MNHYDFVYLFEISFIFKLSLQNSLLKSVDPLPRQNLSSKKFVFGIRHEDTFETSYKPASYELWFLDLMNLFCLLFQ